MHNLIILLLQPAYRFFLILTLCSLSRKYLLNYVLYVLLCPKCSRAVRALVHHAPRVLLAVVPHVPRPLRALVPNVSRVTRAFVPHLLGASRVLRPIWPRVSHFMSPFPLRTLLPCTLCTLCPNINFCTCSFNEKLKELLRQLNWWHKKRAFIFLCISQTYCTMVQYS